MREVLLSISFSRLAISTRAAIRISAARTTSGSSFQRGIPAVWVEGSCAPNPPPAATDRSGHGCEAANRALPRGSVCARTSGGGSSELTSEFSNFSISALCSGVRFLPSKLQARIADSLNSVSRSWLAARFAADAGLFNSCANPAESLPSAASRSRCCSIRVTLADTVRHQADQALGQARAFSARDPETWPPEIARARFR